MRINHQARWKVLKRTREDVIDQILINRNIDLNHKDIFLKPDFERDLLDPYLMKSMSQSVDRIEKALSNKELVGIFADYDADGVTSGALLTFALESIGLTTKIYIPAREEGYGINQQGIDYFHNQNVKLLIAVDMGITGKKEIEYAISLGMDVIVVDHHLVQVDKLPFGLVINPKQDGDAYKFKDLSACGLVYKLATALALRFPDKIGQGKLRWWLDLVAISTVADMVPLIGENRVLAYYGLIVLKKTKSPGIRSLCEKAGINLEKINPGTIGFQIAPRLNAPGRIDHANIAFEVLTSKDLKEISGLALKIQTLNLKRQDELELIISQAKAEILKDRLNLKKVIMLSNPSWSPGLVGLVAGRLMEEFVRPVIILQEGKTISRGSARSISSFHLLDAFQHISDKLLTFGGHARAGGLSLENKKFNEAYKMLLEYAEDKIQDSDLIPEINIDVELKPSQVSIELAQQVGQLEPFGYGNQKPVFLLRSQLVQQVQPCGKDLTHIKLKFGDISGIRFSGAEASFVPKVGETIDVVFSIQINTWNNQDKVEAMVIDWHRVDEMLESAHG